MRVDYQRITDEMYEPREERQPPTRHMLIAGLVLVVAVPFVAALYFVGLALSLAHEFRGF